MPVSKRVTLQDIADRLGYSKNTISLALRNSPQIPQGTKEKIQRAASKLGYRPNAIVSRLMAELRSSQKSKFQAKLALLNANDDPNAFTSHPTIPIYVEGCHRRANQLGYSFDSFWIQDTAMTAKRLIQIFKTRNIKGLVVVGLMGGNQLPSRLNSLWESFPVVVTGVRTRNPTLSFVCVVHHMLTLRAVERLIALGYKRPALVLDDSIDLLVERRFSAGFKTGQVRLENQNRIPPFLKYKQAKADPRIFKSWILDSKPDVVLTLYNSVSTWIQELGWQIPEDIGFAQLERRPESPQFAGMDQHNDIAGEAAVDMVISQIHNNESGIPKFPRATLIGATWTESKSILSPLTEVPAAKPSA